MFRIGDEVDIRTSRGWFRCRVRDIYIDEDYDLYIRAEEVGGYGEFTLHERLERLPLMLRYPEPGARLANG